MSDRFVLVTGATGFVGKQLCPMLVRNGYRVRATSTRAVTPAPYGQPEIEWLRVGPIGPLTNWENAVAGGITHVVHLAAVAHRVGSREEVDAGAYDEVNHQGTVGLARAVARTPSIERFVFMSSIGAVTSLSDVPVDAKTPCRPDTAYGTSKLAAEMALQRVFADTPKEWCILRPSLLYGPGNPGNMARLLSLIGLRIPLPLGSVRNERTVMYVGNLIDAVRVALVHPAAARNVFCLGDVPNLSTPELMRGLGAASGEPVHLFPFPVPALKLMGKAGSLVKNVTGQSVGFDAQAVEKLCGSLPVDSSQFRTSCDWAPPFSLQEGLRATVAAGGADRDKAADAEGGA